MEVSRLRWPKTELVVAGQAFVEIPHLRGVPVATGDGSERVREWPNRAGILERGSAEDRVLWNPGLAPKPLHGNIQPVGGSELVDFDDRLVWFRGLLRRLAQLRGVSVPIEPEALCGIVLTRGKDRASLTDLAHRFPEAVSALPRRLAEFPGGVQLALTDYAWTMADQYAGDLGAVFGKEW